MKAVVLVGGFGTRLRPLTLTSPKQMLPVIDRPMLEHVIGRLGGHGVDEVVLSLGYKEDVFREAYPNNECAGVALAYAVEPEPLDTAGAVRFAADAAGINETFIVINGDVFTDLDVTSVWNRHHEIGAEATIALTPVDDPSRYGVVPTDPAGKVLGFVEKPPAGEAPTNWINAGTYVLEPSVLQRIETGRKVSIERETFPAIVADGGLWAVQSEAYWVDAGTPETYIQIQLDLLDGVCGDVVNGIAADASVDPSAVIERSVVMSGATVAANAIIRGSIVSMDAVIGERTLIEGSIVGPRAVVGAGSRITELTMLGDSARVDGDASLAGAKIPENK
ncbi:MAG: NDP-sugar synthase [Acidimicrobiaceae bacterium]|jgi:mannose-1-phosphate guanylyltransferase|nr:NDP-sugar synthase [Acidimicrobiaceae bacterium]MBT5581309.1 NDP-sugar synthase [Acidimicrobiaceae bacterium]MBT5851470.1 NDP-sugar synthase [Acidimicrobiaceae bacterium]